MPLGRRVYTDPSLYDMLQVGDRSPVLLLRPDARMRHLYALLLAGLLAAAPATAQITVASAGDWSDPATWSTGAVPTASDDVVLDSTVTIDIADAVVNNVTIRGAGDADGELRTARGGVDNVAVGITVFGDLMLDSDAELKPLSNKGPNPGNSDPNCSDEDDFGFGEVYHRLTVHGDVMNAEGGTFDMRRGSTSGSDTCNGEPSAAFIDLVFAGSEDAIMTLGDYDSNDNQLFRVTIAKTDGAVISLGNSVEVDNNSRAVFTLESGYLDTGDFRFTVRSNNSQIVQGGSPASYVRGEFARGLPKGTASTQNRRGYPMGDSEGFRPLDVYVTERPSDDQWMGVRLVEGDADTGSSVLEGGLMDVSPNRYYAVTWYLGDSADPITIDRVAPSYGSGDGVPEGETDFVVASSTDGRMTWTNAGGVDGDGTTPHTTSLASPPTYISATEPIGWTYTFDPGTLGFETYYAAVATTDAFGSTAIEGTPVVGAFELAVSPNPSTGRGEVSFALETEREVTVEVFDVLGRHVATLADGPMTAGTHALAWDGTASAPGLYVVRLAAGADAAVRTFTIAR